MDTSHLVASVCAKLYPLCGTFCSFEVIIIVEKEGYLPLSRRFFGHPFWKERRKFSKAEAWIDILRHTQYEFEPIQRIINGQLCWQCYGEAIMSTRYCGQSWGWHKTTTERFLNKLEDMEQIMRFCGHNIPYIIVINFERYDPRVDTVVDTVVDTSGTPSGHPCGQIKELNKSIKSIKSIKTLFVEDSIEFRLADLLFTEIRKNNPHFKAPNLQQWAGQVDLMIRIDKRVPEQIEQIIVWCQDNDFWRSNILSTQKLRKQYDQLLVKMNGSSKRQQYSETTRRNIESFKDWVPPEMRDR
jgi:hypothetical protein